MSNNPLPDFLTRFIGKYLVPVELLLALAAGTGYLMMLNEAAYGSPIFAVSLTLLAVVYFLAGFAVAAPPAVSSLKYIMQKVLYISLSVAIVGLFFRLMELPGAANMLTIGGLAMLVGLLATLPAVLKERQPADTRMVIRVLVVLIFVFINLNLAG